MKNIGRPTSSANSGANASYEAQIQHSLTYLDSAEALASILRDSYWPKWNSPWWHMLLLFEMGRVAELPQLVVNAYVEALNRMPLKIFPMHPHEMPSHVDPYRGTCCHCQLGLVYQVLYTRGVPVDSVLPWIRPWFVAYQMEDGGLNCDNEAYLVKGECPSSMVGTIGAFESILLCTNESWTQKEIEFLDRCAHFLIARELRFGSSSAHNAQEVVEAQNWTQLCFPRFYFYDVLRGLRALLLWATKFGKKIPRDKICGVVDSLGFQFPDGQVRIGRRAFESSKTLEHASDGSWAFGRSASLFPLLESISCVGEVSEPLTLQWEECLLLLKTLDLF